MSAVLLARPGDDVREIVSLTRRGGVPIVSHVNLSLARRCIDAQDAEREYGPERAGERGE
jgi:hypothetical protein